MTFIFASLNKSNEFFARLVSLFPVKVYYIALELKGDPDRQHKRLFALGIKPIPLAKLDKIIDGQICYLGPFNLKEPWVDDIMSLDIVKSQADLYPGVNDVADKIYLSYITSVPYNLSCKASVYARCFPNERYFFVIGNVKSFFYPITEKNIVTIYFPDFQFVRKLFTNFIIKAKGFITADLDTGVIGSRCSVPTTDNKISYVVHKGLNYGGQFDKDVFYSRDDNSVFCKDSMLYINYSEELFSGNSIPWLHLSVNKISSRDRFVAICSSVFRAVPKVRRLKDILGIAYLVSYYIRYLYYKKVLSAYSNNMELALIDYEILCPKPLLLAFESLNVETVAVQERFLLPFNRHFGTILTHYLCASDYSKEVIDHSTSYYVDHCYPIGQYRSDNIDRLSVSTMPEELQFEKIEGKQIIVVLGLFTHCTIYQSETDPLISWEAIIAFTKDMIALSKKLENVFVVLRFKNIDWIDLPMFEGALKEVNSEKNIMISKVYSQSYHSYRLCSFADLIIAQHTSLADECLSRDIPVLFYDYTHNRDNLISSVYDYGGSDIVCHSYNQLLAMSTKMLAGDSKKYLDGIKYIYGSCGDGHVRERIHKWLENKFKELDKRPDIQ